MPFNDYDYSSKQYHKSLLPLSCILLLNRFPKVGKLTIAKAFKAKLKLNDTPH